MTARPALEPRSTSSLSTFNGFFGDLVVTSSDEALGSISDLWIEMTSGRVVYVIVSSGGFMGRGERLHPVPWAALRRSAHGRTFVLDCQKSFFLSSPALERSELGTGSATPEFQRALQEHYRMIPSAATVS